MHRSIIVAIIVMLTFLAVDVNASEVQATVGWEYPSGTPNLAGFRLYKDMQKITDPGGQDTCYVNDPLARELICRFVLGANAVSFTLVAFDNTGSESGHSEACQYDPTTNKYSGSCMGPHIQILELQ